jgi:hypothetical protein
MRFRWLWSARDTSPSLASRVNPDPIAAAAPRKGIGVFYLRSGRPTHHLWRFDARRDARLASRPKAAT